MMAGIELKLTMESNLTDFYNSLSETIKQLVEYNPQYESEVIIADAPYAAYVEYGTGPVKNGYRKMSDPDSMYSQIRDWAEKKLGLKGKALDRAAYSIYIDIAKNGLAPHPFLRSAIYTVFDEFKRGGLGHFTSMDELADAIVDRAKRFLSEYGKDCTGALAGSIRHEPLSTSDWDIEDELEVDSSILGQLGRH